MAMTTKTHANNRQLNCSAIVLGIDIGTSGIRGCIVEKPSEKVLCQSNIDMPQPTVNTQTGASTQNPNVWIETIEQLFTSLASEFDLNQITHTICDATSSTVLLANHDLSEYSDALMYNDSQAIAEATEINSIVESLKVTSAATGESSTAAKVALLSKSCSKSFTSIVHQIDFINYYLCSIKSVTDENNALKLGYDSINQCWPKWLEKYITVSNSTMRLPKVVKPGSDLGTINETLVNKFGLNPETKVLAGTTDSIAGFLATGANKVGEAVTSLGSTIAIKAISSKPIFAPEYGLYSHKLWDWWLVGGASNAGGMALLQFYDLEDIIFLLEKFEDPCSNKELNNLLTAQQFYPLTAAGERFPIADSQLQPNLPVMPNCNLTQAKQDDNCLNRHLRFFSQLLAGLTQVEQLCYQRLQKLGSDKVDKIYTVGGGIHNHLWMQLRSIASNSKTCTANNTDAAFGVTRLLK